MGWRTVVSALAVMAGAVACGRLNFAATGEVDADASVVDAAIPDGATPDANLDCTDTQEDPDNCGTCGHSCGGGQCAGGECQPLLLAGGQQQVADLELDGGFVYWVDRMGDAVMRCGVNGCAGTPELFATADDPTSLTIDATRVYWANYRGGNNATDVRACDKTGCTGDGVAIVNGVFGPFDVAVDATTVYFTSFNDGTINSCPLAGCVGAPTIIASGQTNAWRVIVDDANAYWTRNEGVGSVQRCALGGCPTPAQLATNQVNPARIVQVGDLLVWVNGAEGSIRSSAKGGGGVTAIASGLNNPAGLAIHNGEIFWIDDDAIWSCPLSGCDGAATAQVPTSGFHLIVTDDTFYWANGQNVWKLAR